MVWKQTISLIGILFTAAVFAVSLLLSVTAFAQSSSNNYKVNEYFFGIGGQRCEPGVTGSSNYCADMSIGETTVGSASSDNYMIQAGYNTSDVPILEVAVNGNIDFEELSIGTTKTGTATAQVRTYLASGYVMTINGPPPTYLNETLNTPGTPTASAAGTEQFGINLATNTSPAVGSSPVQVPDGSFSYGIASASYSSPDQFMYQDGATIAYSDSSSGQTNYTISFIANMSSVTAAGRYTTAFSLVVTSTF